MVDVKKEVEAILFSAGRAVLLNEFLALLHLREAGVIQETIKDLKAEYESRDSPMMIVEEGAGWKLAVKERFLPVVQRINPHTELSRSILETLSVIAWKHPVLQSEVIRIRTNKAYDHISELERLGFVARERHGRSFMIKVTPKFLEYFDLPDFKAIKETFRDFKDIESAVQKKVDEFEKEEAAAGPAPQPAAQPGDRPVGESVPAGSPSIEVKPYTDELPEVRHVHHHASDVETYSDVLEDIGQHAEEEGPAAVVAQVEKAPEEILEEEPSETAAEKARRLAQMILAEDAAEAAPKDMIEERKLHPKLEKMIEGMKKPPITTPEPKKPQPSAPSNKQKKAVVKAARAEEPAQEEPAADAAEESAESDVKMAEEFPGQFGKPRQKK